MPIRHDERDKERNRPPDQQRGDQVDRKATSLAGGKLSRKDCGDDEEGNDCKEENHVYRIAHLSRRYADLARMPEP